MIATIEEVIGFWREAGPEKWFSKDDAFDVTIRRRFLETYREAAKGALASWEDTPEGLYALLILLDQFPRNMFRDSRQAFATDALALKIARRAIAKGFDRAIQVPERRFFYTPHMHAEDLVAQEECIALCERANDPEGVKFAIIHRNIIRDFGRFPHRNAILGRETTPEEAEFLAGDGFKG